jgi:hypothetical protein
MNLRRGLLRLWVVLTLIWVAAMSWMFWDELLIAGRFALQTPSQSTSPLAQYRQQYPEYRDLTDEELATKMYFRFYSDMSRSEFNDQLYSKFYSDMPRSEFEKKFGLARLYLDSNDRLHNDGRLPDSAPPNRTLMLILLPPCIVLIVGIGLFWAAQGFRHQRVQHK